jgi:hypothetical protein
VREQLGLGVAPPVKLVAALVERLRAVTEERDQLREELQEQQRKAPKAHLQRPAEEASSSRSSGAPTPMRWFVKQLRRRQQERELDADLAPRGDTLAEVAAATEERLRQLAPLPYAPAAVLEAALDMGLAAMDLARAARRAQRR